MGTLYPAQFCCDSNTALKKRSLFFIERTDLKALGIKNTRNFVFHSRCCSRWNLPVLFLILRFQPAPHPHPHLGEGQRWNQPN